MTRFIHLYAMVVPTLAPDEILYAECENGDPNKHASPGVPQHKYYFGGLAIISVGKHHRSPTFVPYQYLLSGEW